MANVGRVLRGSFSWTDLNPDGTTVISQAATHFLGGEAGFGLILMPTSPWSVCLGASGLYGTGNSREVFRYIYFGNQLVGSEPDTLKANFTSWNTRLEASVGFVSGEQPVFAPRAGISFEYGGQTREGVSDTYTGFVIDIGTGVRYGRFVGLVTYFRVLTREFSDSPRPAGTSCSCPDGLRVGLGVVF